LSKVQKKLSGFGKRIKKGAHCSGAKTQPSSHRENEKKPTGLGYHEIGRGLRKKSKRNDIQREEKCTL